ncbi:MAG TPA: glycerol-3-phosphate dehydrogenase [Allosphingosinicella sp.]|nr:glycerol-3-phosphate dehydrogenase [Allosphingosinicella sp.]
MDSYDLLIVGGGINGCAIARDASIRGASVLLVEKDDLAGHTSSASSKLIHGGLRYLEYGQIRLVREALEEREILLRTAPHIVRPLLFVLPHGRHMRPQWMIRAGLLAYDLLSIRGSLPRSRRVWRDRPALQAPLKDRRRLLTYWDASTDDSRLTVLNAVDAAENGAEIRTRTALREASREGDAWRAELSDDRIVAARAIVNAGGPWVSDVLARLGQTSRDRARLVKGSHIAVPKLWDGDHAYILQQPDGRVVFAMPFEAEFTLIGTTDVPVRRPEDARISEEEIRYLCEAADRYFNRQVVPADVVWRYSGIRALYDDGHKDAKAVTRDYHLELEPHPGPKLLSVFGGKITTARALAKKAVDMLGIEGRRSTGWKMLPGGDLYPDFLKWLDGLSEWLPAPTVLRMSRAYGTRLKDLIGDADSPGDLGRHYGAGLYEREVQWLVEHEFARTAEDLLWRRSKLGLHMSDAETKALAKRMGGHA